mmetsp:Transcript_119253/g.338126  ORF Transcript_119253/g.338126 Transcript_119253/m.338126 type:complete len:397 (+) Transcript_119253:336-1526(+)
MPGKVVSAMPDVEAPLAASKVAAWDVKPRLAPPCLAEAEGEATTTCLPRRRRNSRSRSRRRRAAASGSSPAVLGRGGYDGGGATTGSSGIMSRSSLASSTSFASTFLASLRYPHECRSRASISAISWPCLDLVRGSTRAAGPLFSTSPFSDATSSASSLFCDSLALFSLARRLSSLSHRVLCSPSSAFPRRSSAVPWISATSCASSCTWYSSIRILSRSCASTTSGASLPWCWSTNSRSCCAMPESSNHPPNSSMLSSPACLPLKAVDAVSLKAAKVSNPGGSAANLSVARAAVATMSKNSGKRSAPFALKSKHWNRRLSFSVHVAQHQSIKVSRTSNVSTFPSQSASRFSKILDAPGFRPPTNSLNVARSTAITFLWRRSTSWSSPTSAAVQERM